MSTILIVTSLPRLAVVANSAMYKGEVVDSNPVKQWQLGPDSVSGN